MGNTKLLIRAQLVQDALTSVLTAGGFNVLHAAEQCSENTALTIDFDDYADPERLVAHRQAATRIVVLASTADCQELERDQISPLSGLLTYDLSAEAFVRTLRLICSGERVFPRGLTLRSKSQPSSRRTLPPRADAVRLSPRRERYCPTWLKVTQIRGSHASWALPKRR